MRRSDVWQALWRRARGFLPHRSKVLVAGAGPSGLHLAHALGACGADVTVYEPARCGGVRIPLLHACNLPKRGSPLWQAASAFARQWYAHESLRNAIERHDGPFGNYFSIHTRRYLHLMRRRALEVGVQFVRAALPENADVPVFVATGVDARLFASEPWAAALAPLAGWESYFALRPTSKPVAGELARRDIRTNYFTHGKRAAFIHLNHSTQSDAERYARALHPNERHGLFFGRRLITRDRLPVVGFLPPSKISRFDELRLAALRGTLESLFSEQPLLFYFTGMGFHAMTYSPFLADRVARWLTGKPTQDEILLGALTPARFLPR